MAPIFARLAALLVACAVPAVACITASAEPGRRALGVVLVYDQGYFDLGCCGATEARTPRTDALAAEGMRSISYFAASPLLSRRG